jgi:hypothetical protein
MSPLLQAVVQRRKLTPGLWTLVVGGDGSAFNGEDLLARRRFRGYSSLWVKEAGAYEFGLEPDVGSDNQECI